MPTERPSTTPSVSERLGQGYRPIPSRRQTTGGPITMHTERPNTYLSCDGVEKRHTAQQLLKFSSGRNGAAALAGKQDDEPIESTVSLGVTW